MKKYNPGDSTDDAGLSLFHRFRNQHVKDVIEKNTETALQTINEIISEGKDISNFLWEIIKYIKDLLVYKSSKVANTYNEEEKKYVMQTES